MKTKKPKALKPLSFYPLKPEDVLSHDKASRSWEIHILLQTMLEPLNIYPT